MRADWDELRQGVQSCAACELAAGRSHTVLGEGNPAADIMFVGEGPGREEDLSGRPFVGPAGKLLDKMLASIALSREEVYICNVVKCRPPGNRTPKEEEAAACLPYLRQQYVLVQPKILVCLGATAAKCLYDPEIRITRQRGQWREKKGVWFLPTYHPAALLRDVAKKPEAWEDMQAIASKMEELGLGTKRTEG